MNLTTTRLVIVADAPSALLEVCGITLLDRLLRQAQRIGAREALVLSATPEAIRGEIARPSWARAGVSVGVKSRPPGEPTAGNLATELGPAPDCLLVPGDVYCDQRLLQALLIEQQDAVLSESPPVAGVTAGFYRPCRVSSRFLNACSPNESIPAALKRGIAAGEVRLIEPASIPSYDPDMRRDVPALCIRVTVDSRSQVETIVLDAAQKGTLDLPAYAHAPIETSIISVLCRTFITPNQITVSGFLFGMVATISFATGHFVVGLVIALLFGVIDGLDGKLARVKCETTARGKWEHRLDLVLEYSWWIAIAWGLRQTAQLPSAFFYTALLIGGELSGHAAKAFVRRATGRILDDVSSFDRFFRLVAGRRNIFVWLLVIGWCWAGGADAYRMIAIWSALSAAVHLLRAFAIRSSRRTGAAV